MMIVILIESYICIMTFLRVESLNVVLNISILKMSQGDVKSKYVEFINEALSAKMQQ
jgi:hypothetical protein